MDDDNSAEQETHTEMSDTLSYPDSAPCGETLQSEAECETAVSFNQLQ